MKRYNIVTTSLIVVTSIMNHYGGEEKVVTSRQSGNDTLVRDWASCISLHLKAGSVVDILLGVLVGFIGFIMSDLDIWFGVALSFATAVGTIISRTFKVSLMWVFQRLDLSHSHRSLWTVPVAVGCQDFIRCLMILQVTWALVSVRPIHITDDDVC